MTFLSVFLNLASAIFFKTFFKVFTVRDTIEGEKPPAYKTYMGRSIVARRLQCTLLLIVIKYIGKVMEVIRCRFQNSWLCVDSSIASTQKILLL